MSKRTRIYTIDDVTVHRSLDSCWVARNGKVYDVTHFLSDHPGGDDLILKYAGQDIGEIMKNPNEHDHSESAYDMLDEFIIGRIGTDAGLVDEGELSSLTKKSL
jgi:4-hydroxysphinganine ceramide fatty acyl 2-hydroxylase